MVVLLFSINIKLDVFNLYNNILFIIQKIKNYNFNLVFLKKKTCDYAVCYEYIIINYSNICY